MLPRALLESLNIGPREQQKIDAFVDLFEKWNQRINLSGASTRDELMEHVEDCLHVVPHIRTSKKVLDVGSGGGFPVAVAALLLPTVDFVALEPIHKKHAYLSAVARELQLPNLRAYAERVEAHQDRNYDAATSRATFDIRTWMTLGASFLHKGGIVIGFEATEHPDLVEVERYPYTVRGKKRNLVCKIV